MFTTKGNQMENVTLDAYNPHALITVRKIAEGDSVYQLYKATELEEVLNDASIRINQLSNRLQAQEKQIGAILNNLTADNWYSDSTDKSEVLSELCDILGHEAKQTVRITATISVEVDYEVPLDEVDDFDAHYFLQDNLTVDTYNGDSAVDSWTVEDHSIDWN
jgi:hypothetical protein